MGFQNERLTTDKNGMAMVWHVAIATQYVSATDGIDCSIFSICHILKIMLS